VEESRILPMDRAAAAHLILCPDETRSLMKRLQVLDLRVQGRELRRRTADRVA